ncbi:YobI family P-loop NTPase [Sulfurospirillum oryzae]|uniref:YobI family P-loop NTPase n=1 Tax=Sulfurospirillum oryzae TaxID=2976535 RepID=UPI0021E973BB|nr:hypothetical protein [Sulfurospirillum oryzae]
MSNNSTQEVEEKELKRHKYKSLAPTILSSKEIAKKEEYFNILEDALDDENTNNIAITSPYGGGKSSFIRTFISIQEDEGKAKKTNTQNLPLLLFEKLHLKKYKYKFLHISLASFGEKDKEGNIINAEQERIEKSILEQMFFGEKWSHLKHSGFKRIKNINPLIIMMHLTLLISWIIVFLSLWNIGILNSFYKILTPPDMFFFSIIIGFVILSLGGLRTLSELITYFKIKKLVFFKDVEIEITGDDKSVLNRYIDEILYFFEETEYNVVVFEDLDRFEKPEIFRKLREINLIINKSRVLRKKLKQVSFIYAVKDEVFDTEARTKFFDYIIPLVPVISSYNSYIKLKEELGTFLYDKSKKKSISIDDKRTQGQKYISNQLLKKISYYITDMRLLINITNEFRLYHSQLDSTIIMDQLLSIIVFKNIMSSEFSKLQKDEGTLFSLFNKTKDFIIDKQIEIIDAKIANLKREITETQNTFLFSIQELNSIYLMAVQQSTRTLNTIYKIYIEDEKDFIDVTELLKNADFLPIIFKNKNLQCQDLYNNSFSISLDLQQIEEYIPSKLSYRSRLDQINNQTSLSDIRDEIDELEKQKQELKGYKLSQILTSPFFKDSMNQMTEKEKETQLLENPLIKILLQDGLLNEQYHTLISYFMTTEGELQLQDKQFLMWVLQREKKKLYDYQLTTPNKVAEELQEETVIHYSVLNFDLFNEILSNFAKYSKIEAENKSLFTKFLTAIKETTDEYFVSSYFGHLRELNKQNEINEHIKILAENWDGLWNYYVHGYPPGSIHDFLYKLFEVCSIETIKKQDYAGRIKRHIENDLDFEVFYLRKHDDQKKAKEAQDRLVAFLQKNNITLLNLGRLAADERLLQKFYESNLYMLNAKNVSVILSGQNATYTNILKSQKQQLIERVNKNLNNYLKNELLEITDPYEDANVMLDLINAAKITGGIEIEKDTLESLIKKKIFCIDDINKVMWDDKKIIEILYANNKVSFSWKNIVSYADKISDGQVDETLFSFLQNSIESGTLQKYPDNENFDKKLVDKLFYSLINEESDYVEEYDLTKSLMLLCPQYKYLRSDFTKIDDNNLRLIIELERIELTPTHFERIWEKGSHNNAIELIKRNFDYFIKRIDTYDINSEQLKSFLDQSILIVEQKEKILQKLDSSLISNQDEAKSIYRFLTSNKFNNYYKFHAWIMQTISMINHGKLSLQLLLLEIKSLNEKELRDALILIKHEKDVYYHIATYGKDLRRNDIYLEITDNTMLLITELKKRNMILNVIERKNCYRFSIKIRNKL